MQTLKYVFAGIIVFLFGILAGSILLEEKDEDKPVPHVPVIMDETQLSGGAVILNPAECTVLEEPMQLVRHTDTPSGKCLWIPEGAGKPPDVLGRSVFEFAVKKTAEYTIWLRTNWEDGCSNSVHAVVNDQAPYIVGEDGTYGYWKWRKGPCIRLKKGIHRLELRNREDGVRIDQILITPDSTYQPSGGYAKESHVSNIRRNLIKLYPADRDSTGLRQETVHFTDDFMREEKQLGEWNSKSGQWRIYSVKERTRSHKGGVVARSVNPFSLRGQTGKNAETALITTGRDSWTDYAVEASVKVLKNARGGICMNCDAQGRRYQLTIQENWPDSGRVVLEKVIADKATVLYETEMDVRQRQWYRLRLENSSGRIRACVDETCVFDHTDKDLSSGRIGLAAGKGVAFFDDVAAHGFRRMAFDFSTPEQLKEWDFDTGWGLSTPVASEKTVQKIMMSDLKGTRMPAADILSVSRFDPTPGYLYTGTRAWKNYQVSFDVWLASDGAWEFHFYRTDNDNTASVVFEKSNNVWTERVVRIKNGRKEVLAEAAVPLSSGKWVPMKLSCKDGFIRMCINGQTALSAVDSVLKHGGFGFRTNGNSGIFIDNISIEFAPEERFLFAEHNIFKREATMKDWAWKKNEWVHDPENRRWIHRRDFRGPVTCIVPEANLSGDSFFMIIKGCRGDDATGCRIIIDRQGGTGRITLSENGRVLKQAELPPARDLADGRRKIMFREKGGFYLVYIDDALVLWSPIGEGAAGTVIMLSDAVGDIEKVDISSVKTRDYFFHVAPVDWYTGAGNWEVRNRWRCAPQWSWFGALEKQGCSVIWSKRRFDGDLTLDVYCSFKMLKQRPPYNTHDLNITICGNGQTLEHGYSFIYGGWRNSATAIMKNGKVVASTKKVLAPSPIHGMPNVNTLHRRWFFFRIEKKGDTVTYFIDDEKVLEYKDPEPIRGGHAGIWTQDNGMMLARARISYSREKLSIPQRKTVHTITTASEQPAQGVQVKDAEYTMTGWDFQSGEHGWKSPDNNIKLFLSEEKEGNRFLAAISDEPGSRWRIHPTATKTDLKKTPYLSFRYALDSRTRINLYLRKNGLLYRIRMSGPDEPSDNIRDIGCIPEIKSDGKWHTAFVNLYSLLASVLPADENLVADQLYFGVEEIKSYLPSGIGGNPPGSKIRIDDFYLFGPRGKTSVLVFSLPVTDPNNTKHIFQQIFYDKTNRLIGKSEQIIVENTDTMKMALPARTGLHYLTLWDDQVKKDSHIRVPGIYDNTPPQISKTRSPSPVSGICELTVQDNESGVDIRSVELRLPTNSRQPISFNRNVFRYFPRRDVLAIDLQKAGISISSAEQNQPLAEVSVKNLAGLEAFAAIRARDLPQEDNRPPQPCAVSGSVVLAENDFNQNWKGWSGRNDVCLELAARKTRIENTDDKCLRITGLRKSASLRIEYPLEFNPEKYPFLQFDYKFPDRADVDLYLNTNVKDWVRIRLSDPKAKTAVALDVKDFKEDNQWHTCRINLAEVMSRAFPDKKTYRVYKIDFCDGGFRGCPPYTSFCIDNFIITGFSRKQDPQKVEIQSTDFSGPVGMQTSLVALPSRKPVFTKQIDSHANTIHFPFPKADDGAYLLKTAGIDKFGNRSLERLIPLLVDSTPPKPHMSFPEHDTNAASSEIVFQLPDSGFSDARIQQIEVMVNEKSYSKDSPELRIDRKKNILTWDTYHTDTPRVFTDRQRINVSITVTDAAGNKSTPLQRFWTMDYSQDTEPSVIRQAYILGHTIKRIDTFEEDTGTWENRNRRRGSHISRFVDEHTIGRRVLCMKNIRNNGHFSARIIRKNFQVEKYPYISFLYNVSPGTKLDFLVGTRRGWRIITFTDAQSSYKIIGRVPGVQADNQWHQGFIDLAGFMEEAFPNDKNRLIRELSIGDWGRRKNKKGDKAYFDDFIFLSNETTRPRIVLNRLEEPTGLTAAAVTVDNNPSAAPHLNPENVFTHTSGPISFSRDLLKKGAYLHVAVRDGAGNWSKPVHINLKHQGVSVQ